MLFVVSSMRLTSLSSVNALSDGSVSCASSTSLMKALLLNAVTGGLEVVVRTFVKTGRREVDVAVPWSLPSAVGLVCSNRNLSLDFFGNSS